MKFYKVQDHEPSILPDGEWEMTWSDEFDGTELDRSKWDYRMTMMQQEHPAWTDEGVELDGNSNAVFKIMEKDGRPVSSQLQTGYNYMDQPLEKTTFGNEHLQWRIGKLHEHKFTQKYGYFECRCRLQQMLGWWSAFWIQSPLIGATLDPSISGSEIDVMECFKPGEVHTHNVFTGGYGKDMKRAFVGGGYDHEDMTAFHRFGVLWDETGYTFYVDGKEDGHISDYVSHCPEFILITTEVKGYRHADHQPIPEAWEAIKAGDTFLVDYVRVFSKKEG